MSPQSCGRSEKGTRQCSSPRSNAPTARCKRIKTQEDQVLQDGQEPNLGSAKTDRVRFKWGFGEGLLKDKFAFSRLVKVPYLRGENCLQKNHFYKQKGPCLKPPLNWTGSVFPLLRIGTGNWCELQTRPPGTEVKSADLAQRALERAQKVFVDIGAEGWLHWRSMGLHGRKPCLTRRK